ncbi:hypothetical protein D3C81_1219650 [compost metagenome]
MQTAVRGHQEAINRLVAAFGVDRFEFFEGHGLGQFKGPRMSTTQFSDISATTEYLADVLDQGADVGTFGATD